MIAEIRLDNLLTKFFPFKSTLILLCNWVYTHMQPPPRESPHTAAMRQQRSWVLWGKQGVPGWEELLQTEAEQGFCLQLEKCGLDMADEAVLCCGSNPTSEPPFLLCNTVCHTCLYGTAVCKSQSRTKWSHQWCNKPPHPCCPMRVGLSHQQRIPHSVHDRAWHEWAACIGIGTEGDATSNWKEGCHCQNMKLKRNCTNGGSWSYVLDVALSYILIKWKKLRVLEDFLENKHQGLESQETRYSSPTWSREK